MSDGIRIGIDIGGTSTRAVAIDAEGTVLMENQFATLQGADAVLSLVCALVAELRDRSGRPLLGVGVGVPGVVEWPDGLVAHAVNIGVERLALGRELSERLDTPVWVDNDVNVAALGAARIYPGGGSLGFLNVGTGLAAGVILEGALWRGTRGVVGEIGHVAIDPAAGRCPCGQMGCLELIASGSALARALPRGVTPGALTSRLLLDSADVRTAFDAWVRGVAMAARMLVLSVGVDRVVVGGGAAALGTLLHDALVDVFDAWSKESPFIASLRLPDRTFVGVPDRTATLGAALLVESAPELHPRER
ncbi:N-acetylglucosamine repressor [Microbacterium hydrocarbonoxydans]|uniref:N-acetylglucosamine repressor n=1 Tax=Microbacterium hydrocarbonoxydans TaxID=273678 RepID=A0A0M2HM94_9MICO|nr:ROK family protein [Microbacterium hydrocarbonoxydans]KJL47862.1 N-acetylglucosamine repressor [Microbacterium hydrocarbonoxydans]